MKHLVYSLILFFSLSSITACQSKTKSNKSKGSDQSGVTWSGKMQDMAVSLQRLMPFVYSHKEFSKSKNRSNIVDLIDEFQESVEVVPEHIGEKLMGKDPLLTYSLSRLRESSKHAKAAFKDGHVSYARNTLKGSINTCFNCHTSNTLGPELSFSTQALPSSFMMYPTEKADYYVATRQYSKAAEVLEKVLESPTSFYDNPHEQSLALKKYLALEVRVEKKPARAIRTIKNFLNNKKLPHYLEADTQNWLRSLEAWNAQAIVQNPRAQARRLLQSANRKERSSGYQSGLVEYLRATSLLHEALKSTKSKKQASNIYLSLGKSYESLTDLGLWDLPDIYFEACIRSTPRTKLAKKCYKNYERNIILGFSGSAGIFIPEDERKHLEELKRLAGLK